LTPSHAETVGLLPDEWSWALPLARLACLADAAALELLRSSRALQERVRRLRQGWQLLAQRPWAALDEPERFALHSSLEAELPALLLLLPSGCGQAQLLERWRDPGDPLCHPRPPLDGHRLQQLLQRGPGPWLGQLLRHLSQERAWGRLATDANETAVLQVCQQWFASKVRADGSPRRD
jgi:tRNA nucleotidyltransferase (CCA-adding enzyme)